jgi:regulator of cell morphogenesis and NO signaling
MIDSSATLGDLVTANPARARALEALGLDYCCGGRRTLGEACTTLGRDVDEAIAALAAVDDRTPPSEHTWDRLVIRDLVDHIEATHHSYLRAETSRLIALGDKVRSVHRERHPELDDVVTTLRQLWAEVEPHLATEESELFPACRDLDGGSRPARRVLTGLRDDHEAAGDLLDRLRADTGGFTPPADGCGSYRAFYAGLAELDADTRLHVHKENNLLFPAVEQRLGG